MPSYIISGPYSRPIHINSSEYAYVGTNGELDQAGRPAITSNAGTVYNYGSINSTTSAIEMAGDATILNYEGGEITSPKGIAVEMKLGYGSDFNIQNDGKIAGYAGAISMNAPYANKTGTFDIENGSTGLIFSKSSFAADLINNGGESTFANEGFIGGRAGVIVRSADGARTSFSNAEGATISTRKATVIDGAGSMTFTNKGTLVAKDGGLAVSLGGGADSAYNTGTIVGHVHLGGGNDYYSQNGGSVQGSVIGGGGNDVAYLSGAKTKFIGGSGIDSVITDGSYKLHHTTEELHGTGSANTWLIGNDGGNVIVGTYGNNVIKGGGGRDHIVGRSGNDRIDGGSGHDTAYFADDSSGLVVNLKRGFAKSNDGEFDTLRSVESAVGGSGDDLMLGTDGNNVLKGLNGNDRLHGLDGNDRLIGGEGNDVLVGASGNDVLHGGADHDKIYGGTGNDKINGGSGTNEVWGGKGADTFVFDDDFGSTYVKDFNSDQRGEKLDLRLVDGITDYSDLMSNHITEYRGHTYIYDSGDYIILENIALGDLDEGDFLF